MNKIYIKKRLLKEANKDEEEKFLNSGVIVKPTSLPRRKRKRRTHRVCDDDEELDPYWANMTKSNLSISNNNNNSLPNDVGASENLSAPKGDILSREEKKLQYYLDMIQRQEKAEIKKQARKHNKTHKVNHDDFKNSKKDFELNSASRSEVPLKISIVTGTDPELDILARSLRRSVCAHVEEYSKWTLDESDISLVMKCNKDELISWSQSEDQNESTFDRLRTPTQINFRGSSVNGLHEELNGFENFRISNLLDKSSLTRSEHEITQEVAVQQPRCLKKNFWEQILLLTKQKQADLHCDRDNSEPCEAVKPSPWPLPSEFSKPSCNPNIIKLPLKTIRNYKSFDTSESSTENEVGSNNSPVAIKPIFKITRKRKSTKGLINKFSGSCGSTEGSHWSSTETRGIKASGQACKDNEAVLLVS